MYTVKFKKRSDSPVETYKDNYVDMTTAIADKDWLSINAYWFENGIQVTGLYSITVEG